ncbi:hypothetical protein [Blautia wexlerae]
MGMIFQTHSSTSFRK